MKKNISSMRKNYSKSSLDEFSISQNPFAEFEKWFELAKKSSIQEANAFCLSTSTIKGLISSRILLLKDFSEQGFIFFTNYRSKKANQLKENPNAAILFFWDVLEKQIRIEGKVYKTSKKISEEYFYSRPKESQIGALISSQSEILNSKSELEIKFSEYKTIYENKKVPFPKNWGGYILKPVYFEFWQGRPSRLHDRLIFIKTKSSWKLNRLFP